MSKLHQRQCIVCRGFTNWYKLVPLEPGEKLNPNGAVVCTKKDCIEAVGLHDFHERRMKGRDKATKAASKAAAQKRRIKRGSL